METLRGTVIRITYQNGENGYSVLKVEPDESSQTSLFDNQQSHESLITVTGSLALLKSGDLVDLTGEWTNHPKYGTQFTVSTFHVQSPTTKIGLTKFLASDHFKGVGNVTSQNLVETFGESLVKIIENDPDKLTAVKGITHKKAQDIHDAWENARDTREQHIQLQGMGLTPFLTHKVLEMYGAHASQKVLENPYQLAQDVYGIGFKRADEIAGNIGFFHDHPYRIASGITYTLIKALDDGHMFLPFDELVQQSQSILGVDTQVIELQTQSLIKDKVLMLDQDVSQNAVYLSAFYNAEQALSKRLILLGTPHEHDPFREVSLAHISQILDRAMEQTALSSEQAMGIKTACTHPISVLTGGPGTGKSTTINTLISVLEQVGKTYVLTAPTGRAAKRLSELSDRTAYTVHRLLKLTPGDKAEFHSEHPLPYDMVIVDEVSMLDTFVMYALVNAVKLGSHILFVGDGDQLPSVQAGNVLSDIISSQRFPVVTLSQIFRQAKESDIIVNAHRIKNGQSPILCASETDFYFIDVVTAEEARGKIIEIVSETIPEKFGFVPQDDIQVLSPLYKTPAGVTILNKDLQDVLNPKSRSKRELIFGYSIFREGDRVMQLRNNYEKDVFNGDVGSIRDITVLNGSPQVTVSFGSGFQVKTVRYEYDEMNELTLSYAASVHKSQGSEYPVVVMPMITSHYIMLQRNLLYTGITRAKSLVYLVGQKKALFMALKNDKPLNRYTGLAKRLRN